MIKPITLRRWLIYFIKVTILLTIIINLPSRQPKIAEPEVITKEVVLRETIYREIEVERRVNTLNMSVCSPTATFKSYMEYYKVTNKTTRQYEQLVALGTWSDKLDRLVISDNHFTSEGILVIDGYYAVAMAQHYGAIGDRLLIEFADGLTIPVILADFKKETCTHKDGSMIEFVVNDKSKIPQEFRDHNYTDYFKGNIVTIRKEVGL